MPATSSCMSSGPRVRALYNLEKMWSVEALGTADEQVLDDEVVAARGRSPPSRAKASDRSRCGSWWRQWAAAGDDPAQQLFEDYRKRLPWPVELREVRVGGGGKEGREARGPRRCSRGLPADASVIALDGGGEGAHQRGIRGETRFRPRGRDGRRGVPDRRGRRSRITPVLARADTVLSLGPMTWPHLLVRAMLAEQLWRAASILSGHPYHRG